MEEHYAARELAAAIERFLDTQSKENRVLFMRRYWYADSFAEIGKLLGITEGNARLRLTRMRKQLKTYLTEQEVLDALGLAKLLPDAGLGSQAGTGGVAFQSGTDGGAVEIVPQLPGGDGLGPVGGEVGQPAPALLDGDAPL